MPRSLGPHVFRWIGVKRLIPTLLGFFHPGLRGFFSGVEDARIQGRSGGLELEESRNLCVLDGIFSTGYSIVLGLIGMGVYYLVFDLFGASWGAVYSDLLILAVIPLLATAAVEVIDFVKISLISLFLGGSYRPRLIGYLSYFFLFLLAFLFIFCFFFVW